MTALYVEATIVLGILMCAVATLNFIQVAP